MTIRPLFSILLITLMLSGALWYAALRFPAAPEASEDAWTVQHEWNRLCRSLGEYTASMARSRDLGSNLPSELSRLALDDEQHQTEKEVFLSMRRIIVHVHQFPSMTPTEHQRSEEMACFSALPSH